MAVYQAILGGQIDAESYVDTVIAGQWTNNLLAVVEADPSAPKIINLTEDSSVDLTAGTAYAIARNETVISGTSAGYARLDGLHLVVPRTGEYTASFEMRDQTNGGNVLARIYVNKSPAYSGDVAIGAIQSEGDGAWTMKTEIMQLNAGDIIVVYGNRNSGPGYDAKNLMISSAVKLFGS